jgi:hypothetical protein
MYVGQKVKYIKGINATFNNHSIYTISGFGISNCNCKTPYITLKETDHYPPTSCGHKNCRNHVNDGPMWDTKIFKPILSNINKQIKIL